MSKCTDISGQKFGRLTVVKFYSMDKTKRSLWECLCSCGRTKICRRSSLVCGNNISCGCANREPSIEGELVGNMPQWYYSRMKYRAKKKKIEFNITMSYLNSIYTGKCALSGLDLVLSKTKYINKETITTASIDRIDSSKGYIEGNVQWIHKDINSMKMNIDQDKFIEYCRLVSNL